jgi:hypothetical protein
MITPTTPNKNAPERKQKITITGCGRAAAPSASGPNNWSIEMRSAVA